MKIVLIVLAALTLLLLCPIRLDFCWNQEVTLTARWLFFKFGLLPQNKKKNAPKAETKQAAADPLAGQATVGQTSTQSLTQYADLLPGLLGGLKDCLLFVLRHTKVKRLELNMLVSREDAAETAIAFGRANQAVYTALGLLQNLLKFGCTPKINIGFDYLVKEEETEVYASSATAPLFVLVGGVGLAFDLLKGLLTHEKETETAKTV